MGLAAAQSGGVMMTDCRCEYCTERRAESLDALRIAFDTPHFDGWHDNVRAILNGLGLYPLTREGIERAAAKVLDKVV